MITSLKIAKIAHLTALKFSATKSIFGIGVLAVSTATGVVAIKQFEPDYIDAAVALVNQAAERETGLTTLAFTDGTASSALATSVGITSSNALGTIETGVGGIRLNRIPLNNESAEDVPISQ